MNSLMKTYTLIYILALLPFEPSAQVVDNFKSHTAYLASDELQGRGTGSEGIQLAADYIAKQFNSIGLQPINNGSYFQKFPYPGQKKMESNVIGIISAAIATKRSIVFTAHYDAYGIQHIEGSKDSIHNGARDNAIGVAALIELAQQFSSENKPMQNIVFIATAGEEFGAYGSQYYVDNAVFPKEEITICLNIDGFNVSGPREDYFIFPRQGIDFIDEIESISKSLGWQYISPDWIDSMNTNFDTASFLAKGVPAFTLWTGGRLKGGEIAKPIQFGQIHGPDDEINEFWNWEGVEDHISLYKAIANYFLEHPSGISVTNPQLFVN